MKLFLTLLLLLVTSFAFGANIGDDALNLGDGNNASTDKSIIFNDGSAAASRKKLSVDGTTKNLKSNSNNLELGDNVATGDKSIVIKRGGSDPVIKWNETLDRLEFSNDGTLFKAVGSGGGGQGGINILTNGSFEDGISLGWTNSGGTFTQETYDDPTESNLKFARFVASGSGQYVETSLTVVPTFLGAGCQAQFEKYATVTDAAWKIVALDSSGNVLATQNFNQSGGASTFISTPILSFPCPAAGDTVKARIESLAAATIDFDLGYLGGNKNTVDIAQARFVGESYIAAVANCGVGGWATSSTTMGSVSTDADCPGPTIVRSKIGTWLTTDTDLPKQTINNLPPGLYLVKIRGTAAQATAGTGVVSISDGTTTCQPVQAHSAIGDNVGFEVSCSFEYSSTGNRTFELVAGTSAGTMTILNAALTPAVGLKFIVEYFPLDSQTAVTSEQSGWFVDANIGGANPSLGVSNVSTYTGIENSGLDMVLRNGSSVAEIGCSSTNSPTGLTCSSGNESLSVAWTPPYAGWFDVCFNFTHFANNGASGTVAASFQVVETAINSQTIISEGGQRSSSGSARSAAADYNSQTACGSFYASSVTKKMMRLMYEQTTTATVDTNIIHADRDAAVGQRDIRVTVRPSTMNLNRPVLVKDDVRCSSRIAAAANETTVCSSGTCTQYRNRGACFTSVANSATGSFLVTVDTSKINPATMNCSAEHNTTSSSNNDCHVTAPGSTFTVFCRNQNTSTANDQVFTLFCEGDKP